MSYKTILVHVDESRHLARRVEIAAGIAALHGAHLVGVAVTGVPDIFYDPMMFNLADPAIEPLLQERRKRAADALARFEAIARKFPAITVEARLQENETAYGVSLQARYCDLAVLGQYDAGDLDSSTRSDFAETVILHAGVPALMIPYTNAVAAPGQRALVAWNASKEAVRALHYALPILERAGQVDVAVFDPATLPTGYHTVPDKDILEALQRHGINAKVTRQATGGDIDIGNALLSLATDLGSDLLVMGCYGHARFREILLGGATRQVLKSMTIPVLMAH